MDKRHFDELARSLADGRLTRRSAVRLLSFGALGSRSLSGLAGATAEAKGADQVQHQGDRNRKARSGQCKPSGIKCRLKATKGTSPSSLCKNCCETFQKRSKSAGKCCSGNGKPCSSTAECCLGECSVGLCQNTTVQLPPSPPPVEVGDINSGGPPPPPPPPPGCVAYGGSCTRTADCCDGVPCSGSLCRYN